jgi:hypothetical protein
MKRSVFALALSMAALLVAMTGLQASAAPVCPPPTCAPTMCAPSACQPMMTQPMCGPMPMKCKPPACAPPPMCGPTGGQLGCYPPPCKPNPFGAICRGTFGLVTGVLSFPFKVIGSIFTPGNCKPDPCRRPPCPPIQQCGIPQCPPPTKCGPPAYCPPPQCPPSYGYGMRQPMRPMRRGPYGNPGFVPFSKKGKSAPTSYIARGSEGASSSTW